MTERNMTAAYSTALSQTQVTVYHLYRGEFVDGTLYLTDLPFDTTYDGNTYVGAGAALGYDAIEEVSGLQANGIKIYLNGASNETLSLLLAQNLIDRPVYVYRGLLDANNQPVIDPIIIFEGRSDSMELKEDPEKGTLQISLECFDENVDFERVNGRRTNHEEQQLLFPGDKGFEFIADGMDKLTKW